jgi:NAD(P)H dehydrogenase (quinone)
MYAVMGITGQVGSAVANSLLERRQQVRAIVRNPEKAASWAARGVELAVANYEDASALEAAFRGTDGVFAMLPPYFAPSPDLHEPKQVIAAIGTALDRARPPKIVYLSSIGAQQTSGIGLIKVLHLFEEKITSLSIPSASLRAGWFMENCTWDIAPAREQGKFFSYLQPLDCDFALVAAKDIGKAGADTLLQNWKGHRFIEVAGPRRYTALDIAEALSTVLKKKVEPVLVPRDTWADNFIAQGAQPNRIALRIEMLDAFNSRRIDFGVPGAERFTGTTPLQSVIETLTTS